MPLGDSETHCFVICVWITQSTSAFIYFIFLLFNTWRTHFGKYSPWWSKENHDSCPFRMTFETDMFCQHWPLRRTDNAPRCLTCPLGGFIHLRHQFHRRWGGRGVGEPGDGVSHPNNGMAPWGKAFSCCLPLKHSLLLPKYLFSVC